MSEESRERRQAMTMGDTNWEPGVTMERHQGDHCSDQYVRCHTLSQVPYTSQGAINSALCICLASHPITDPTYWDTHFFR